MYSLSKFANRTGIIGKPLPPVFDGFNERRITFRQGATSMIAGHPGSFKSVLALNMMVLWARQGISCVYFSADSDEYTVARRVIGILTNQQAEIVENTITNGHADLFISDLQELKDTRFVYQNLDLNGITNNLHAYEAVYGAYPDVVFLDNLMNYVDSAGEWEQMRTMTRDLDIMAREMKSHICILHHTSEGVSSASPPPRSAIQGKISQIPRLVLTVAAVGLCQMIACVKNTNGPQDATGRNYMNFMVRDSYRIDDISRREEFLR